MLIASLLGQTMHLAPVDSLLFRDVISGEPIAFKTDQSGRVTHMLDRHGADGSHGKTLAASRRLAST